MYLYKFNIIIYYIKYAVTFTYYWKFDKIFTFLSPIFISSFLVLQSFVNFDLKGLAYLIGTFLAYGIGMLVKLFFHHNFKNSPEDGGIPGSGYFTRKPIKNAWDLHLEQVVIHYQIVVLFLLDLLALVLYQPLLCLH